ncbi:MAG: hypothetical protein MJZ64_00240 [Paludibacteraceae bacterium]|nr:hypothetical protein [Paludibacteraceae bacterium]
MAEPITLKGIQRNASKLAVEDGRAEDLINLRFKDGSWRTAGDGKRVFAMTNETTGVVYEQLYIHTNASYHHVLGVNPTDSKLYWFANIGNDGETFTALTTPQEICSVEGDLYINQTGHLITIIDGADDFEYAVFKTGDEFYKVLNVDTNKEQSSRGLYPIDVKFNVSIDNDKKFYVEGVVPVVEHQGIPATYDLTQKNSYYNNLINLALSKATEENKFTGAVVAIAAFRFYDGTFGFASQPTFLSPRENILPNEDNGQNVYVPTSQDYKSFHIPKGGYCNYYIAREFSYPNIAFHSNNPDPSFPSDYAMTDIYPTLMIGCYSATNDKCYADVVGADLLLSLSNNDILAENKDVFNSICVFITNESCIYKKYTTSDESTDRQVVADFGGGAIGSFSYKPHIASNIEFRSKLFNSPFFLLKEYDITAIHSELTNNPIIDLSTASDKNILKNIALQEKLTYESQSRMTYIPKVAYSYNGKLHIANYKSIQFHGYPLESFMLHNRSLKVQQGSTYEGLPNLADNNNKYYQHTSNKVVYTDTPSETPTEGVTEVTIPSEFRTEHMPLAFAIVDIDTGESQPQRVVRYIETPSEGDVTLYPLNPLLSFPDTRAMEMKVYFFKGKILDFRYSYGFHPLLLKSHLYINFSYYMASSLKPLSVTDSVSDESYLIDQIKENLSEQFVEERFPNGLKASKTNNPFYFPVEQAYQIGNGTILAMCSNAIAVGTGQTGAAPLYVFCTDGIYALYVDANGEMAYTNARIIARDVCNNAKSVTPIDTGVVFTTDRGLMEIAGDVVNEIGQPAEGDVVEYTEPDLAKPRNVGKNMLEKVADLPLDLVDGVDFLSYLRGAIINYNHNERELMVSNQNYPYSYILDRYSNWSRRDYSADEYVNNYPTSYRVKDGVFYKVDAEQDGLEGKSEAPNDFLYLSNVIKLGSVDFKKAYRFVVRGKFNTNNGTENKTLGVYVFGSYDGRQFAMLGANEKKGTFTDIGCKVERTDVKYFRVGLAGYLSGDSRIDFMEIEGEQSNLTTKLR